MEDVPEYKTSRVCVDWLIRACANILPGDPRRSGDLRPVTLTPEEARAFREAKGQ